MNEDTPPARAQDIAAVKRAALRVSRSSDADTAIYGVAAVAATCGDCHAMLQDSPWRIEHPTARGATVRADMVRHAWAAASLWDGLVQPSEEAWRAGAVALADDSLTPELLTPDPNTFAVDCAARGEGTSPGPASRVHPRPRASSRFVRRADDDVRHVPRLARGRHGAR